MKQFTGVYEMAGSDEKRYITFANGKLFSQRNRNTKFNIKPYEKDKYYFESMMNTIEFLRNKSGVVEKLIFKGRDEPTEWIKTEKPLPVIMEIDVDESILETYVGEYELGPNFILTVTRDKNQLITQATGQGKIEIFAETETKFFVKVMDAQLEFVKDDIRKSSKADIDTGWPKNGCEKDKIDPIILILICRKIGSLLEKQVNFIYTNIKKINHIDQLFSNKSQNRIHRCPKRRRNGYHGTGPCAGLFSLWFIFC
jgi:hypothetical protein